MRFHIQRKLRTLFPARVEGEYVACGWSPRYSPVGTKLLVKISVFRCWLKRKREQWKRVTRIVYEIHVEKPTASVIRTAASKWSRVIISMKWNRGWRKKGRRIGYTTCVAKRDSRGSFSFWNATRSWCSRKIWLDIYFLILRFLLVTAPVSFFKLSVRNFIATKISRNSTKNFYRTIHI